jgi:hypothetical protein
VSTRVEDAAALILVIAFPIFLDRTDLGWGQNWRGRIEEALDTVTLLGSSPPGCSGARRAARRSTGSSAASRSSAGRT